MRVVPLYTSRGDAGAFLAYPYLYNSGGEWTGFITAGREVYSVLGHYVGYLTEERRILRERTLHAPKPRLEPPPEPPSIKIPSTIPLAPLMSELTYSTVDVLLEEPERLHTLDVGELRDDMD